MPKAADRDHELAALQAEVKKLQAALRSVAKRIHKEAADLPPFSHRYALEGIRDAALVAAASRPQTGETPR